MQVSVADIRETSAKALVAAGALPWIAEAVAEGVAHAEAHGNVICGLYYLESYCVQLKSGRVDGCVEPVVTQPKPGAVEADARYGFAQPAFARGLPRALDAARAQGIAIFSVTHAHTCTSLGYFTEQIARAGFLGIGFTNASAIVAPPGGSEKVLGTNPLAFSAPADVPGALALHFDSSTSAVALGQVTMAKAAGRPIPEGWAVDRTGAPTTDPEAAVNGGALVPAAGYKGWGLGLLVELMASALTGTAGSWDVTALKSPDGPPHDLGQSYLILEPQVFSQGFTAKLEALARVATEAGGRLPGAGRAPMETVEVPDALWELTLRLAA